MQFSELPYLTLREIFKFLPVSDLCTLDNVCLATRLALPSFYHTFTQTQLDILDAKSHLKKHQVVFAPDGGFCVVSRGRLVKIDFSGRVRRAPVLGVSAVVIAGTAVAVLAKSKSIKISKHPGLLDFRDCPFEEEVSTISGGVGNFLLVASTRSEIFLVGDQKISRLPRIPEACLAKGEISDLAMIDILGERNIHALLSDGRLLRLGLPSVKHPVGNFWETVNRNTLEMSCDDFRVHFHDGRLVDGVACPAGPRLLALRTAGAGLSAAVAGQKLFIWHATRLLAEIEIDTPVALLADFALREAPEGAVEVALYFGAFVRCFELLWVDQELIQVDSKTVMVYLDKD
jgi:hypothetical protein